MGILKIVVKILSWICYVIIGVYALVCLPMITGAKPVVVLSGSMRPTYEVGTIIYYKAVPQEEIKPETVITFKMEEELVTHRVKRIQDGEYVTQGDANNVEDGRTVPYSDVQGKVDGLALPFLGFGVQFINSNFWVFILIIAILLAEFLISNIKCDKISVSEKGRSEKDD
ncbi:MAG: signal peptidase I [Candidatus Saccharibacteria bacterium]|nr:signal peptidase I [Candidatus Saccharibacteria bacterium]